jgi:ABC-type multidrug transport system ATPase subunit
MISVLTGMYPQTSGNAWINGLQIGTSSTNKFIGVCPQFDLLWPDLTVEEHLKFYSILKMVKSEFIEQEISSLLKDVDLEEWKTTPSSKLSGGMQRRLSLAISLVGNPKVVFLDEPSSGLDPSHRRQMWNILLSNFIEKFRM